MKSNNDSIIQSILFQKCPQCHEGRMFKHHTYSPKFMQMDTRCSCCGLDFIREPSFYFGAMYFSYTIQVAILVAVYLGLRLTTDPGAWTYAIWVIVISFLIIPLNYRLSRVMWINLFVSFKGKVRR